VAPGRSAPLGGRFATWNGQERAPNREPSQGSTDEVRTSLSRVRSNRSAGGRLVTASGSTPGHAAAAAVEVFVQGDQGSGRVVVQAEHGFEGGGQGSPGGALLGGAVGERGGRDQGEPAGDLPSADAGEQPFGFDLDAGVNEGGWQPFGEVFEVVRNLRAGPGCQVCDGRQADK